MPPLVWPVEDLGWEPVPLLYANKSLKCCHPSAYLHLLSTFEPKGTCHYGSTAQRAM